MKWLLEIIESPQLFDFLSPELIIEIATKRFEYTFESLWKTLKEYLRTEGVECTTPLACFKEAFKMKLIDARHEETFVNLVNKRNQIVHIYDLAQAEEVFKFIKGAPVRAAFKDISKRLKGIQ